MLFMDDRSHTRPARLLLHACCGPCLLEPLDALASEADTLTVFFANPNIHPAEEYARRRDVLLDYAARRSVPVVVAPYEARAWDDAVAGNEAQQDARCRACYRVRMRLTAGLAAEQGYDAISTTLYVSPYQSHETIREEGEAAARAAGVRWLHRDYRDRYREGVARARELGMYRQNYCGCRYSQDEAERSRAEARLRRSAKRPPDGG